MSKDFYATITGSVVRSGPLMDRGKTALKRITVAVNSQYYEGGEYKEAAPIFVNVAAFGHLAKKLEELDPPKGRRITVDGQVSRGKNYVDKNGKEREGGLEMVANRISADILFGGVSVEESRKRGGGENKVARKQPAPEVELEEGARDDNFEEEELDFTF